MRRPVILLVLLLLACSSGIPPGLKYYWTTDPRSLDPALSTDVPTGEAVTLLFDNLAEFDPDGRLVATGTEESYVAELTPRIRFWNAAGGPDEGDLGLLSDVALPCRINPIQQLEKTLAFDFGNGRSVDPRRPIGTAQVAGVGNPLQV